MTISPETMGTTVPFLLGLVLGASYLAILWVSVRSLTNSGRPLSRLLCGAVLRVGLLIGSFYLIMDGHWERLLASLIGFLVVRIAATRWASIDVAPRSTS